MNENNNVEAKVIDLKKWRQEKLDKKLKPLEDEFYRWTIGNFSERMEKDTAFRVDLFLACLEVRRDPSKSETYRFQGVLTPRVIFERLWQLNEAEFNHYVNIGCDLYRQEQANSGKHEAEVIPLRVPTTQRPSAS